MKRILILESEGYSEDALKILQSLGEVMTGPFTKEELKDQIADVEVLVVRLSHMIDREILNCAKKLKVILSATTGLDHIHLEFAKSKGIEVLSLKGETEFLKEIYASSEHTWALLLALIRKIPSAYQSVLDYEWDRNALLGHELHDKAIGVIGYGRIGKKVAGYAKAFGMNVFAYEPGREGSEQEIQFMHCLHDVLKASDIVSLHIPLERETENLMGPTEFKIMKKGSFFINTSRGQIVDEQALVEALKTGHLAGAAVDVICDEQHADKRSKSPLLAYAKEHANLIITPHIGGSTRESMRKTEVFMAEKLKMYLELKIFQGPKL